MTLEFEVNGDVYEVEVSHFSPPERYTWGEPVDSGEIELSDEVVWVPEWGPRRTVHLNVFLDMYADDHRIAEGKDDTERRRQALSRVEGEAFRRVLEAREDEFDDRDV